jgi:hypothetical protein
LHLESNQGSVAAKTPVDYSGLSLRGVSIRIHENSQTSSIVFDPANPIALFGEDAGSSGSSYAPALPAGATTNSTQPYFPASGWNPIFPLSSSLYDGTDSIGGIAFDICHISWPRVSTHASTSTPSTISRAERHVLIGPHLPKAFSCTPVHRNIAPSHARRTVHCTGACTTTHISSRGWSCRKTRANRFTITESSLVHLVARKARPQFETQCSAASKRCCSPLASLRCYNLVVAVAVCSAPARSCCILPSSCCLQHPLLVLIAHNTLYNC